MKLIEAMKKIKDLQRKADDVRAKIAAHSADMDFETAPYPDQKKQVSEWLQGHSDLIKEILKLRIAIQKTNLATQVSIELDGKSVTKSIAEWIHRRRDLAKLDLDAWSKLTDRNLREGNLPSTSPGTPGREVKIRRYFDPLERDKKLDLYKSEPLTIDSSLEIANAITDIME